MWAWACARVATLAMVPHRGRRRGEGIALTSVHIHSFSSTHQFDHTKHKTFTPRTEHLNTNTQTVTFYTLRRSFFHRPFVSQLHVHVSRSLPARFIHMVSNYSYIYEPCMRHTNKKQLR